MLGKYSNALDLSVTKEYPVTNTTQASKPGLALISTLVRFKIGIYPACGESRAGSETEVFLFVNEDIFVK
jgi:hypothetical protein